MTNSRGQSTALSAAMTRSRCHDVALPPVRPSPARLGPTDRRGGYPVADPTTIRCRRCERDHLLHGPDHHHPPGSLPGPDHLAWPWPGEVAMNGHDASLIPSIDFYIDTAIRGVDKVVRQSVLEFAMSDERASGTDKISLVD